MYGRKVEVRDQGLAPLPPEDWDALPEGLTDLAPGPELAALLATIDRDRLSGLDRVELLTATSRMVSHYQARLLADMESIHRYETENPDNLEVFWDSDIDDMAASEIQAALHLTPRAALSQLDLAQQVCGQPDVWRALESGLIDLARTRDFVEETRHLPAAEAKQVITAIIDEAPERTTGQLRVSLARLCMQLDPDSAHDRYQQGLEYRRVVCQSTSFGTANLFATDLPAPITSAVMRRINHLARAAKGKDDPRTMDQIRADVFLDLLGGGDLSAGAPAAVDIRVDLTTLIGLDESPGDLSGFGPLVADVTRQVVAEQTSSQHRVTVTDNDQVIWSGITRRRPTADQRRSVEVANPTCVFPGCRMPSAACDLDHRQPWSEGGPTVAANLEPLCRRDHRRRHAGWRTTRLDERRVWVSPLGRIYPMNPQPP
jgi:hypothetical protein